MANTYLHRCHDPDQHHQLLFHVQVDRRRNPR